MEVSVSRQPHACVVSVNLSMRLLHCPPTLNEGGETSRVVSWCTAILDLKRAQEWVVTTKLGSNDKRPGTTLHALRTCRLFPAEAIMAVFVLSAAGYAAMTFQRLGMSVYLVLQGEATAMTQCSLLSNAFHACTSSRDSR